ncbi:MAG TPA: hypothetical protein VGF61_03025 [Candidatus Acidoferrum sp.]|jgi:hypothetical protein
MNRNSLPRCSYISQTGRRCRSSAASHDIPFCHRHQPAQDPATDLVRNLEQFRSAGDVTVFLSRLISSLSKDQISTRRAAVLSYVAVSLMHALRSLERERTTNANGSRFDPLPMTWAIPTFGYPDFIDEHDARAFYAQQYAHKMRKVAEQSLAKQGVTSPFAPYYLTALGAAPWEVDADPSPSPEESPLVAFARLSS